MKRVLCFALFCSTLPGCAPLASDASPIDGTRSYVLARMPAGFSDSAILSTVLKEVQDTPEYHDRLATQSLTSELYAFQLKGSCAAEPALVAEVQSIARSLGALDTSCVPKTAFTPGEPISFRHASDPPAR